jgi:uncharacterized protein (DUF58 family)
MTSPLVGWGLAMLGIAAGYIGWGWPGVVLGITVLVFWLLLQFSRSLRVLRQAASAPVGHVDSAVMLQSKLQVGMTLAQVLQITRSLGVKIEPPPAEADEAWRWRDGGGNDVTVALKNGRTLEARLERGKSAN